MAPGGFKIKKVGTKFAVVNGIGITKKTFADHDAAAAYLKTLSGSGAKGDLPPWLNKPAKSAMIEGDDLEPKSLASAVDAALDAAAQQIMANDVTALPGWAQQVCSLAIAAGETVDELLEAMGVPDPDDGSPGAIRALLEISAYMQRAKAFPEAKRDQLAKSGAALPDGSFPIETPADVDNAIQAFGRAKSKPAAKGHIVKRAKALGVAAKLPEGWRS